MSEASKTPAGKVAEKRYELKLVCAAAYLPQARLWLRRHPAAFRQAYPPRTVHNLYFDSPDLQSLRANLAGVSRRKKVRLRWYGCPGDRISNPVLEVKRKENMVGDKVRYRLPPTLDLSQPYADLRRVITAALPAAVLPLWTAVSQPTLLNRYQRDYLVSPDGVLRATLDYDLVAYDQRLAMRPNRRRPLPLTPLIVIEVKAPPDAGDRLRDAMRHFPLPRSRNSKYASGVLSGFL